MTHLPSIFVHAEAQPPKALHAPVVAVVAARWPGDALAQVLSRERAFAVHAAALGCGGVGREGPNGVPVTVRAELLGVVISAVLDLECNTTSLVTKTTLCTFWLLMKL